MNERVADFVRRARQADRPVPRSGGLADGRRPSEFDLDALVQGTGVELEHTDDLGRAMRIAMDHLVEDDAYYQKLAIIESNPHPGSNPRLLRQARMLAEGGR